jgi:hypothetical protein
MVTVMSSSLAGVAVTIAGAMKKSRQNLNSQIFLHRIKELSNKRTDIMIKSFTEIDRCRQNRSFDIALECF